MWGIGRVETLDGPETIRVGERERRAFVEYRRGEGRAGFVSHETGPELFLVGLALMAAQGILQNASWEVAKLLYKGTVTAVRRSSNGEDEILVAPAIYDPQTGEPAWRGFEYVSPDFETLEDLFPTELPGSRQTP